MKQQCFRLVPNYRQYSIRLSDLDGIPQSESFGRVLFFTVVTHHRRRFLCEPSNIVLLKETFRQVKQRYPFDIEAIIVLSEHLHCVWRVPERDADYSTRWRLIKSFFSRRCEGLARGEISASSKRRRNRQSGNVAFGSIVFEMSRIGCGM